MYFVCKLYFKICDVACYYRCKKKTSTFHYKPRKCFISGEYEANKTMKHSNLKRPLDPLICL